MFDLIYDPIDFTDLDTEVEAVADPTPAELKEFWSWVDGGTEAGYEVVDISF